MKFIDFLKTKLSYAIFYFVSITIAILVMYLTIYIKTSYLPIQNVLYAYLVSVIIFIIFLIYEYSKVRLFYKQLDEATNSSNIIESIININGDRTIEQKYIADVFKKLHKEYVNKIYKYEENQKQYTNFINQWVHQMKTPVSVINLILQEENSSEFKGICDSISEENEKISNGLSIMLYNARINEFNHDFNVEALDIVSVLRKVINDNKKLFIRQSIFPKITGANAIIQTDNKWIYFVINQIVINAVKYTAAAERSRKIVNFNIDEDDKKVTLCIEDNGIGIPNEDLGRVFNAFFTGKNGRKTSESTGMGMYLAKRICDELGHNLYAESECGEWTKFFIVFKKGKNIFNLSKL
jgi:signal transduction histidine kinase